ncbi:protocadherin alpha-4-like [Pteropus vampyrus]|uniref:Protocadherin alpha-4-like n=1 Tax=Pteropus vampyrus TaxID=132908 RepID=A0A6P3RFK9_PTEVA|nr:protocadherin alpha-4-like [Pteropus vampyrus]
MRTKYCRPEMELLWRSGRESRRLLLSLLFLAVWETGSGQVRYSVPEEAKHGTFVGRIAQDLGLELEELVPRMFRVASKGSGDLLEVNLQNGILFVNSRIDREELCGRSLECSIHLEVIVERPLQVFHVEVEVRDINDNPPVFPGSQKNLFMAESRPLDSWFPLEGASDADVGANALLTYRLSPNEYFSLEKTSDDKRIKRLGLVLRKPLDREESPEIFLMLTATDGGKPELTGTIQLLVIVLDANDNTPAFDRTLYTVKLPENVPNGTLVIKLNASDLDEGSNGDIIYSFSTDTLPNVKSKFHIDPITGELIVKGYIDFEESKSFEIFVEGIDKGQLPLSGHCTVMVEVEDTNDNVPIMEFKSLSLPIREDAPLGTVIALISVSDRDSGVNRQVTCTLLPHVPFKLVSTFNNYYSLVLDSALDRENVANYELVVTARDGGSPSLSATASVSVEVADVNDNAPVFAQPEYTVFVKENNPPGCHIFTVSALDADVQENALVSYSLVERRVGERALSSYVSVHAESGKVYALQPLDHEELELLQFQVSARDAGVPSLGSNVTLQVFVLDENDNAPALLPPGSGSGGGAVSPPVARSVGAGHVVAKVRAVDADSGYNAWLSYELLSEAGGTHSPFRVGLYTGEISTTRALDEADAPRQRLLVLVKDHGEPALAVTATVLLSLADSGQTPNNPSRMSVEATGPEAALVDVNVYLIIAICAVSSLLVLTLLLYTALRCSAPPTEGACGPGKPTLVCSSAVGSWLCSQQRRQRVCSGECPPKTDLMAFSPSVPESGERVNQQAASGDSLSKGTQKNLFIAESRLLDSRFPLEGASDADIGANALLTYRLSPNEYFSLDVPTTDEQVKPLGLVLRKSLDREEAPEIFLVLTATDGGKPELTGTVQLLVTVLDANDNAPAFDRTLYAVKLPENVPNGTLVIKLHASDIDEDLNGDIIYSFSSDVAPDVKSKFYIDRIHGEIIVIGHIDFEESKTYKIRVEAIDKGLLPLAGHCTVLVEVVDANDNAPKLTVTSLSLPISEDAQPGTVITLINVSDRDSDVNGLVTCTLSPHVPFKLVSTFKNYYSLVLDSTLDRESVANYELLVTAQDGGSPSLSATTRVSVEVADVNDNAPAFAQPEYTVFVKENNPPGCHIFTVSARDADAQENALVSYSLVERRVGERALSSYVSVHAESGKVYALQPLDHEELELLQFQVSARDAGVPPLGSKVTLQVFVLDENDNAPALLPPGAGDGGGVMSQLVARSVGAGHVVAKVRAVDADSGYNAWLSYELQSEAGGARSPFRVGLYTGEISTTRALDEADAPRQRLLLSLKE